MIFKHHTITSKHLGTSTVIFYQKAKRSNTKERNLTTMGGREAILFRVIYLRRSGRGASAENYMKKPGLCSVEDESCTTKLL